MMQDESSDQFENSGRNPQLSAVVIALCKGMIDRETEARLWQQLLSLQLAVSDYVEILGLELIVDEAEGYAFLRARDAGPEQEKLPRLVARRPLSFHVSLLLALFREKMAESDASGGEMRVILSRDEVVEMIRVFLPDGSNEVRLIDQVDSYINKIVAMGFARRLKGEEKMIELHRIIKSFVDAQWLAEFDMRLGEYRAQLTNQGA
ncbi:MAG: hypothetical protein CO186_08490 [Zetaproteobacteria bacterium CG_4_9_14_3_um_filter_49_83]|nr:MAG: hypothetical protein COW62_10035 [Zetaproteobacteria bacterium CG17_big_fil_post_rev_8_21_14_2_50_50_13]PIV30894.1 MAG: hypothetical protein COS35_04265 [Zetaproteobacteria bacterium CG02_land_8_20_14_3_00_50_9]PIY55392.1 MAG: hypothetical protein COZ00_09790 [Zetaproteobacteria bacterium CG_4_10_14_0_8_um_filter_49_80]PJA34961.1 MAG: hypothetical protein CO186_08490 [Zetaproteobacteria bacterium CG_4_9_14_3_um_filter_49_83]